jgi:hypothetical protein
MTGIAFSWIGSTIPLGSVVMIENSVWSPILGRPVRMVGRYHAPDAQLFAGILPAGSIKRLYSQLASLDLHEPARRSLAPP